MEVVCIPFAPYVTSDMCIRERKVQTADALIKVATYVHTQTRLTPYTHLSVGICFFSFRFSSLLFPSRLQRTNERMNECTNGTLTSVEEEVSLPANENLAELLKSMPAWQTQVHRRCDERR